MRTEAVGADRKVLLLTGRTQAELVAAFTDEASPRLARMWAHFLRLARQNPVWFSPYSVLAWLVTGEEPYREIAREHFLSLAREKDQGLLTDEVQTHTHTATAPLVHTMVLYDWIHGTGLLTRVEEDDFAESMLDLACQTALVQLRGRARSFDNQVFSSAACATVTGYVIGRRHGMQGRARALHARGHHWLLALLALLSDDCYSLEGSTYHELIVLPLITLAGAFVEEVDGIAAYRHGVNGGTPIRDWLVTYERMIGESGLMPGWDQYGVMRASAKLPLVYRARRDGCGEPLAKIEATGMWYLLCHSTWEMIDRLWSLVWWDDHLTLPARSTQRDWMNPRIGGAIHSGTARLFQYWDEAAGAPHAGRPQVNPNACQFDLAGLPLLLDGEPPPGPGTLNWDLPAMRAYLGEPMLEVLAASWNMTLTEERVKRQIERAVSGNVGASNSLIIDDEDWYVPLQPVRGKGIAQRGAGGVKLIQSDAAAIYADRYDLTRCIRTSLLVDDAYVVMVDQVSAATAHRLTWQAFTWPGAVQHGNRVTVNAGGIVGVELLAPPNVEIDLLEIAGSPRLPCGGSTRVRMAQGEARREAIFPVCVAAQKLVEEGIDMTSGWRHCVDGVCTDEVDLASFYLTDESANLSDHHFSRQIHCTADDLAAGVVLRLANGGPTTRLLVNGVEVAPTFAQVSTELEGRSFNFPLIYGLDKVLREGPNELCFTTTAFRGETIKGPLLLQRRRAAHATAFSVVDDMTYVVDTADGRDTILLGNGGEQAWLGGRIEAMVAVQRTDAGLVLLGARHASLPDPALTLSASQPIDLAVRGTTLHVGRLPAHGSCVIRLRENLIQIDTSTGIVIAAVVAEELTLHLDEQDDPLTYHLAPGTSPVEVDLQALTPEMLYRYGDAPDQRLVSIVRTALDADDWRIRAAGVDLAARFALHEVLDELLACFAEEGRAMPFPRYKSQWSRSKMNKALASDADHRPDQGLVQLVDDKGYRLRQGLAIAFGLIGDSRSVAPLREGLREGRDHFLALAQIPVALARLEAHDAIPLLREKRDYAEVNVRQHVRLALDYLEKRLSREAFESQVNPCP